MRLFFLILIRIFNALTIKTFFQPDEYWQSLEPAHKMIYGYGYLTWEWTEKLRSAAHPLIYAAVYKLADIANVDVVVAPKIFQGIVAGIGDWYMGKLTTRLLGSKTEGRWAVIVSVGSAFNWYCMTRTFSNSLEMVLTTIALSYWPWEPIFKGISYFQFVLSLIIAALSCICRPTNSALWMLLGMHLLWKVRHRPVVLAKVLLVALILVSLSLVANTAIDYWYYGELTFPLIKFIQFNVVQSLSGFYGVSDFHYYISQGLPILLIGYLPLTFYQLWVSRNTVPARLIFAIIFLYSLLSHKEVRFIYPLIPFLHLLFTQATCRFPKWTRIGIVGVLILFINVPTAFYFTQYHQRGVIDVIDYLRHDKTVTSVGFLVPCHSTPWQSHLHRSDIDAWFLTCEPPIHIESATERAAYRDIADQFYDDPLEFLDTHFPGDYVWPSHLVIFEHMDPIIKGYLEPYYAKHATFFNSHFHDDYRRRGDVIVYKSV